MKNVIILILKVKKYIIYNNIARVKCNRCGIQMLPKLINKNRRDDNNNIEEKKKKPLIERKGDWLCPKCRNLNFAFRLICNRCQLAKSEVENMLSFQQNMSINGNLIGRGFRYMHPNLQNNNNNIQGFNFPDYKNMLNENINVYPNYYGIHGNKINNLSNINNLNNINNVGDMNNMNGINGMNNNNIINPNMMNILNMNNNQRQIVNQINHINQINKMNFPNFTQQMSNNNINNINMNNMNNVKNDENINQNFEYQMNMNKNVNDSSEEDEFGNDY